MSQLGKSRQRTRVVAIAAVVLVVVAASRAVRAQVSDVFSSSGQGFACEGARNNWLARPDDVRTNSECCLVWLQKAFVEQQQALADFDAAAHATGDQQRELVRLGNEAIARRTKLLAQFRTCVNAVIHAMNVAKQGGDATGLMPDGCGGPTADVFGSTSGLGPEVAEDWFDNWLPNAVAAEASCCEQWLSKAKTKDSAAVQAFWNSQASGISATERDRLIDKAYALQVARSRMLSVFYNCVEVTWTKRLLANAPGAARAAATSASPVAAPAAAEDTPVGNCDPKKGPLDGGIEVVDPFFNPQNLAKLEIVVEGDFDISEPGVDWTKWKRDWIKLIADQVWGPVRDKFYFDLAKYDVTITYDLYEDHTIYFAISGNPGSQAFVNALKQKIDKKIQYNVPAFPKGTKWGKLAGPGQPATPLRRTFHFTHNVPGTQPGMHLGGVPQG